MVAVSPSASCFLLIVFYSLERHIKFPLVLFCLIQKEACNCREYLFFTSLLFICFCFERSWVSFVYDIKKMVVLKTLNFSIYLWFISEIFNSTTLLEISSESNFLRGKLTRLPLPLLSSPSICHCFWISYFIFLFLFSLS